MPVPAPILSRGQFFHQYGTKYGAPGSGAYTRYVSYVKRHRAAAAAATGQLTPAISPTTSPNPAKRPKTFGPTPTTGYAPGGVTWRPIPTRQQVGPGGMGTRPNADTL